MRKFSEKLRMLRRKARKSKYRVAQDSGIDQSYILRLETGEKANPSRDVVLMLAFALAYNSDAVGIDDVEELLWAAGHAPFRRRGSPLNLKPAMRASFTAKRRPLDRWENDSVS